MLIIVLTTSVIVLGILIYYIFFLVPRFNPSLRAENFIEQNLLQEAILEYKKILDKNPYDFLAHYKLSEIYLKQDQIDLASQHLEKIVEINKYNYEVDKNEVLKRLGRIYLIWNETERAFQTFIDILETNPSDPEALYHVAFVSLSHGYFDLSYRNFDKLASIKKESFEIQFGAGICAYQNQKTGEAVTYFKNALTLEPQSDIANLAMAFAQFRRRDFKTAINYAQIVNQNSSDPNAVFIAKRLQGISSVQAKKSDEAVRIFEDLLNYVKKNDMNEEMAMILYDLGFASLRSEKTDLAYEYWNQLFKIDRGYNDVQKLIMILRREMDDTITTPGPETYESVFDYIDKWSKNAFPDDFLFNICGLKSDKAVDLNKIVVTARIPAARESASDERVKRGAVGIDEAIDAFCDLDVENFRIISNRVAAKLGYKVDDILPSYREADGVDFMAHSTQNKTRTLIWVRRWKGTKVGEIPLRNFAQAINDSKARQGIFISASDLTQAGEDALKRLSKVSMVYPEQLAVVLSGIL